jgi:serralysin
MPNYQGSTPFSLIPLAGTEFINALLVGSKWGGGLGYSASLTYSFHIPGISRYANGYSEDNEHQNAYALTDTQKDAISSALASWGAVANLTFTKVADTVSGTVGDLRFGGYYGMESDTAAWAYYPFDAPIAGDVWIGPITSQSYPQPGSYDYLTFTHEIGHALGLKHPFDEEFNNSSVLSGRFDDVRYSVMSYNDTYDFQPTGPMLYDIAAMQYIYGSNNTWRTGNDTYRWEAGAQIFETIWDAGGNDTLDASNQLQGVTLNLNSGEFSRIGQGIYNWSTGVINNDFLTIAYGTRIENAIGSDYDDSLIGNDADNVLEGGKGRDTLRGGLGSDTYIVEMPSTSFYDTTIELTGQGYDRVLLRGDSAGFFGSRYALTNHVEELDASQTSNVQLELIGNAQNNKIIGNAQHNILNGGAGADILIGGVGNDTYVVDAFGDVLIEQANEGTDLVQVAIATAGGTYVLGEELENATLTNTVTFNLTGNAGNNVLIGNAANNVLDGGLGADVMNGMAGNDTYIVGAGDTVIEDATGGVDTVQSVVDFTLGNHVEHLTLLGSAALSGTGNGLANTLTGNDGHNVLNGAAGVDTLRGGKGDDTYVVGLTASNVLEDQVFENLNEGTDTLQLQGGNTALLAASTISLGLNFENLDASATGQTRLNLTGNALNNVLVGNAAGNVLNGGDGNDILSGGGGLDTLTGGRGTDIFRFDLDWFSSISSGTDAVITDFKRLDGDKIQFQGQDAQAFNFVGQSYSESGVGSHQLRFEAGILYASTDSGLSDAFEIRLLGVSELRQDDFLFG